MTHAAPLLDVSRAAAIVADQFPQLQATTVDYLGEGYDSTAFDVDDRWVFRFPKRADVEQQLLLEWRVLPVLAKQSPIPLPAFCFLGRPSCLFPRHFAGYPKLQGVPAIRVDPAHAPVKQWASALATFLSWLHAFPVDEAAGLGVKRVDGSALIDEARADALDALETVHRVAAGAPVDVWRSYLSAPPRASQQSSPVLVHRDFAAEHILYDPHTLALTGVIDWSETSIDDRAVDFAGLFHWGGRPLVDAVLASYRPAVDGEMLERARYLAACRGASDVTFGLDMNRTEYVDAGLRALAQCVE